MSFIETERPSTGARGHKLTADEVKAAAAILKKGKAVQGDRTFKSRKVAQTEAWRLRIELAERMGIDKNDLRSQTIDDDGAYRIVLFKAE
jgi:hypothetical protein